MINWIKNKSNNNDPPLGIEILVWTEAGIPDLVIRTVPYGFLNKQSNRVVGVTHYAYIDPPAKE